MTKKLLWMVWFETDPRNPPEKTLEEAVAYYTQKHGQAPNRALVSKDGPQLNSEIPAGLKVEPWRHVRPRNVWLTVDHGSSGKEQFSAENIGQLILPLETYHGN